MDDLIVWVIIVGFYAPLHYLLPVLVLFITGDEDDATRRRLIRRAIADASVSMIVAFAAVIILVQFGYLLPGMFVLFVSMLYPLIGVWRRRRTGSRRPD
jgi:hypothetical protein